MLLISDLWVIIMLIPFIKKTSSKFPHFFCNKYFWRYYIGIFNYYLFLFRDLFFILLQFHIDYYRFRS